MVGAIAMAGLMATGSVLKMVGDEMPILSKYADYSWKGVAGAVAEAEKDGITAEELKEQIDAYYSRHEGETASSGTAAATATEKN